MVLKRVQKYIFKKWHTQQECKYCVCQQNLPKPPILSSTKPQISLPEPPFIIQQQNSETKNSYQFKGHVSEATLCPNVTTQPYLSFENNTEYDILFEPIIFTQDETYLLLNSLQKLSNYLKIDSDSFGIIFTEVVIPHKTLGNFDIKIKLKCMRYENDGKIMAWIQQDYWDPKTNKWLNAKKNTNTHKVHVVKLMYDDYKELHCFIQSHLSNKND